MVCIKGREDEAAQQELLGFPGLPGRCVRTVLWRRAGAGSAHRLPSTRRVQQLVLTRRAAFTRVGNPAPAPHARSTVDHLRLLVTLEEARGNTVAGADGALVDGRPAVVMKLPLDVDAISLELALSEGHELVDLGDRWAVTCAHGGASVVGATQEPGRLAQRMQRTWWKRCRP